MGVVREEESAEERVCGSGVLLALAGGSAEARQSLAGRAAVRSMPLLSGVCAVSGAERQGFGCVVRIGARGSGVDACAVRGRRAAQR